MADSALPNEQQHPDQKRLEALRATGLLDSGPEPSFDRLTRLACRLLDVPVSLISLVDVERQYFKSAAGLPEPWASRRETPLSHSVCQHVVSSGAPLVIADAREHPLVCKNLAIPELGVVAYLGMPLATSGGYVLGALCAIDTKPRDWTAADATALRDLADLVISEIALRGMAQLLEARLRDETAAREAVESKLARAGRLEALGQLAGGITHDFANVLQAVQSGVDLALNCLHRDPAGVASLLEAVRSAAHRGTAISRRLLAFAREGRLGVSEVDIGELLGGLADVLELSVAKPGLELRIEPAPDLPPVRCDRGELETVLVNLATNARDAMPKGGTLTLSAAADIVDAKGPPHPAGLRPGCYLRIMAADTGTGMDAATQARAVEPFFTTKKEGEGTGLGLTMAREFAEHLGGAFALSSEVGRGTTVTLWLPCAGTDGGRDRD